MNTSSIIQHAKQINDTLFYKSSEQFLTNNDTINKVIKMLSDDESVACYCKEMAQKIVKPVIGHDNAIINCPVMPFQEWEAKLIETSKRNDLPKLLPQKNELNMLSTTFTIEQYRYKDIVDVERGEVFFDCGACYGDTAIWAARKGAKEVYSFEPGEENIAIFKQNISHQGNVPANCKIFPIQLATGDVKAQMNFNPNAGASKIMDSGKEKINIITIDEFCASSNVVPTFIKLDVEGFELRALKGAKEIISKHKPKLAVCIYHQNEDMWTLPSYLKKLVPEYKFYCKKNHYHVETVLYATVK